MARAIPSPSAGPAMPSLLRHDQFRQTLVILASACAPPLSASDYTHTAAAIHSAGLRANSTDYSADLSSTPGSAQSAPDYTARNGHSGQLYDATTLNLNANPPTLNEASTRQLAADLLFDDGTHEPLSGSTIGWSILNGPLAGISSGGLATAATVYENAAAVVQGLHAGISGTLTLSVLESIPDNFRSYAGDRLPDLWQVQFLGLENPLGSPSADPDGDGFNNLLEFAFGTDPASAASGPGSVLYEGGILTQRGQPTVSLENIPNSVDFRAVFSRRRSYAADQLTYQVQFSADLAQWTTSSATPTIIASDSGYEVVSVPYPFFLSDGQKARFFRVRVDFTP